ncbi:hypothetical protein [Sporosarcina sp. HYO08]|nr:hypothetical protein [Sporosarcina sp. HYO08]
MLTKQLAEEIVAPTMVKLNRNSGKHSALIILFKNNNILYQGHISAYY